MKDGRHVRPTASLATYLCQIVDVCVLHLFQGVDGSSEGVDLLVGISHKDLAAGLWQHHIHDDWKTWQGESTGGKQAVSGGQRDQNAHRHHHEH